MRQEREPDLLSGYAEIGEHLGISERQAKHLAGCRSIPTFKLPGSAIVRARRSTLNAWLAAREAEAAAEGAFNHAE